MTGRTISHYEIQGRLGGGGTGEVYSALDTRLRRLVAIKVLPANSAGTLARMRCLHEAGAASWLNHPNIVTVLDVLSEDGSDLLVMELVSGKTLSETIQPGAGMPGPQAMNYAVQLGWALAAAHAAGIVHGGIKPGSIMVTPSGHVKVLSFGGSQTAGTAAGTANYLSPEQAEGKAAEERSDVFSFGAVLYEMATGQRAFPGDSVSAVLTAILHGPVRPVGDLAPATPTQWIEIIDRCLCTNKWERWQNMNDLLLALEPLKRLYDAGAAMAQRRLGTEFLVRGALGGWGPWIPHTTMQILVPPRPSKQPPAPTPSSDGPAPAAPEDLFHDGDGVPFRVELAEDVPASVRAGTTIHFTAMQEVHSGEAAVVAQGARVTGRIVDEADNHPAGSKVTFELSEVESASGQKLRVRAAPTPGAPCRRPLDAGLMPHGKKKSKKLAALAGTGFVAYIDGASASVRK